MTNEHVIPRAIGGDNRTVIQVCRPCNSTIGGFADSALAHHAGLRFIATGRGRPRNSPARSERHPSTGKLKDGTQLQGHMHFHWISNDRFRLVFEPSGIQSDGRRWMTEAQLAGQSGPQGVRILLPEEIDSAALEFTTGEGEGLEPGMLKILLGIRYLAEGSTYVSGSSWDVIRAGIAGTADSRLSFVWLDMKQEAEQLPRACANNQHLIWERCDDSIHYRAGICLYGRVCLVVSIKDFGISIPPAECLIPNP